MLNDSNVLVSDLEVDSDEFENACAGYQSQEVAHEGNPLQSVDWGCMDCIEGEHADYPVFGLKFPDVLFKLVLDVLDDLNLLRVFLFSDF